MFFALIMEFKFEKSSVAAKFSCHRILVSAVPPFFYLFPLFACHENIEISTVYLIELRTKLMFAHFLLDSGNVSLIPTQ